MWNAVKMDLLRMWKSRSLYVIWIIMSACIILTGWLSAWDSKEIEKDSALSYQQELERTETVNIGMSVSAPTKPGQKITLLDMCYANMQAKFIALFMVIFAVLFATADLNGGYIKNIAGQVKNRGCLIFSKAVALFVYTVCTLLLYVAIQALSNYIFYGYLKIGEVNAFLKYFGISALLHFALLMICMMFAIALRNNVISIILAICLCLNLIVVLYSFVDKALSKIGIVNFNLVKYTVTGKLSLLSMKPTNAACISAAIVALAFTAIMFGCSCLAFSKRDI